MKSSSLTPFKDPVFELPADLEAVFLKRPNRFLALVEKDGRVIEAHVHDPGRLPDLLRPGVPVLLKHAPGPKRRTAWDLLAGRAGGRWVFAHSGYHRRLTETLLRDLGGDLFPGLKGLSPEPKVGSSRLDYLFEMEEGPPVYVEVKGCTWAVGEEGLFPDAPTSRGRRHLEELISLKEQGFRALLWVLCFRGEARCFRPAHEIDPKFSALFYRALEVGVEVEVFKFAYDGERIRLEGKLPLCHFGPSSAFPGKMPA